MQNNLLDRTLPPSAGQMHKVPFPKVERYNLGENIPFHSVQFGSQEVVDLSLILPAGRYYEPATSVASFTAKLIQEGTKKHDALQFARKLDFYGASIQVEVNLETAVVGLTCLTKHLPNVLPLLAELLTEPSFASSEMENLRQRTIQHLEVEAKKTDFEARKLFNKLLFGAEHPYGRHAERADIEAISIAQLQQFHQSHYQIGQGDWVASGRFDADALLKLIELNFGNAGQSLKQVSLPALPNCTLAQEPTRGYHYQEMQDSQQATVRVGHRAFSRIHPDYNAIQVVTTILGGYFGSRLMRNIREDKGFTYGIGAGWIPMKHAGLFVIQTDVGNEFVEQTLVEIDKEIDLLLKEGVTAEELSLVKNYMLGKLGSSLETPGQVASSLRNMLIFGLELNSMEQKFDEIQAMTPERVLEVANAHIHPGSLVQVVCGKTN